jgi:hypothetical protein
MHRQVQLPELGFTVDEGLEDLIRACWRRGIATAASCIGGVYRDDAEILLPGEADCLRWEDLTGRYCQWLDCPEIPAAAYFPAADVPGLVEVLGVVDESELVERVEAYNAERFKYAELVGLDPFAREVRRRRVEREAAR